MCGIAGIVYADAQRTPDPAALRRMCQALEHRGPDDAGEWIQPGVALGHRRLSIIDLSEAGRQPLGNEDGSVQVVVNGEIYNFRELRKELEAAGHRFRSRSDSEVVVHLYEEHGDSLVERLEGMFAFGLWDARRRRLLLARDRVGKKPLKLAEIPGGIVFASEAKALFASGLLEKRVDLEAVHDYLSFGYVPSPRTGFVGVRKLPAAHRLVYERAGVRQDRYWQLDYREKVERSPEEWRRSVRRTVRAAVERRLVSDVPLGALLSGGVDSSIVVACMAEASSRPVETFSIGFAEAAWNERPFAREVAERYATRHHEFEVRPDEASLLPEIARVYEEPYADASALPTYFLARETRRHVTVALTGDGGDEGFSGYERYARALAWHARAPRPARSALRLGLAIAREAARPFSPRAESRLDSARMLASPDLGKRYAALVRMLSDRQKDRLYRPELRAERWASSLAWIERLMDEPEAGRDPLDRMGYADLSSYLPDDLLVKLDMASMAHSLEARSPLLDREVLELAAAAPAGLRAPGAGAKVQLKALLKQAFRDDLPAGARERPKQGFGVPLGPWFQERWSGLASELLLGQNARIHAWLRPEAIERTIAEGESSGHRTWCLLMLELWHREVVDRS